MNVNVNLGGVAALVFVALLAGAILYWGGGALSDLLPESNAGTIASVGAVLLVVGVVAIVLLVIIAIYNAIKG